VTTLAVPATSTQKASAGSPSRTITEPNGYETETKLSSTSWRASLVIPEGALVVKAALLEEEHDFGAVVVLST
jgi:hypothetical protein